MIDNRNYFDILAKELENEDFNEVLKTINSDYEGKSLEEVVDLIANSDNIDELEKLNVYAEKYEEDILDLRDDLQALEEEYQLKLDDIIKEQEEASRRRIDHVIDYNDYNDELNSYVDDSKDQVNLKLKTIEEELKIINRKEELLNGNLSRRLSNRKEELLKEKEMLEKDKSDYDDLKKEAYYLVKEEEKNIKEIQEKRNSVIKELAEKKIELYKKQGNTRKNSKKYVYVMNKVINLITEQRNKINEEYYQTKNEFEKKVASGDLTDIATFSNVYLEISNKKIEFDNKYNSILKMLNIDIVPEIKEENVVGTDLPIIEDQEEKTSNVSDRLSQIRQESAEEESIDELQEDDLTFINGEESDSLENTNVELPDNEEVEEYGFEPNPIDQPQEQSTEPNKMEDFFHMPNEDLEEIEQSESQLNEATDSSEMSNVELPVEVDQPEEYGFGPNPMAQPQEQPTEPENLKDVLPTPSEEPNKMEDFFHTPGDELEQPVQNEELDDEEPELEFISGGDQDNKLNESEFIDSSVESDKTDDYSDEWIDEEEYNPKEEKSEGLLKKLFGHKQSKEESEFRIKSVIDASNSILQKLEEFNDKIHKTYLDTEGYVLWKARKEFKGRGK